MKRWHQCHLFLQRNQLFIWNSYWTLDELTANKSDLSVPNSSTVDCCWEFSAQCNKADCCDCSVCLFREFTFSLGPGSRWKGEGFKNFVQSQRGAEWRQGFWKNKLTPQILCQENYKLFVCLQDKNWKLLVLLFEWLCSLSLSFCWRTFLYSYNFVCFISVLYLSHHILIIRLNYHYAATSLFNVTSCSC